MTGSGQRTRTIAGKEEIVLDGEGFLKNPSLWSEELARILAHEAGLDRLTADHWRVLRFIHDYYFQEGKAPLNHKIKQGTGFSMMELNRMFPGGIKYGALRLAGIPNLKGCGSGSV
jgi:TusE/DsrC/DsvC family sulfur relay protein